MTDKVSCVNLKLNSVRLYVHSDCRYNYICGLFKFTVIKQNRLQVMFTSRNREVMIIGNNVVINNVYLRFVNTLVQSKASSRSS